VEAGEVDIAMIGAMSTVTTGAMNGTIATAMTIVITILAKDVEVAALQILEEVMDVVLVAPYHGSTWHAKFSTKRVMLPRTVVGGVSKMMMMMMMMMTRMAIKR
jgi:hypothetical protein